MQEWKRHMHIFQVSDIYIVHMIMKRHKQKEQTNRMIRRLPIFGLNIQTKLSKFNYINV